LPIGRDQSPSDASIQFNRIGTDHIANDVCASANLGTTLVHGISAAGKHLFKPPTPIHGTPPHLKAFKKDTVYFVLKNS
jgi:hypothetical protein